MKKATFAFNLPISIFKEGKYYVAYSYALDLSTSGRTLEEAKERFVESTHLFFEELAESGNLDQVLCDLGWEKKDKKKMASASASGSSARKFCYSRVVVCQESHPFHGRNLRNFCYLWDVNL